MEHIVLLRLPGGVQIYDVVARAHIRVAAVRGKVERESRGGVEGSEERACVLLG
jgi:hypothetical protein